jgi:hypothetical protein
VSVGVAFIRCATQQREWKWRNPHNSIVKKP